LDSKVYKTLKCRERDIHKNDDRVVPGHRNWQIKTAPWNLAGFLPFFEKPAGSDLGSFLMIIYRNFSNII